MARTPPYWRRLYEQTLERAEAAEARAEELKWARWSPVVRRSRREAPWCPLAEVASRSPRRRRYARVHHFAGHYAQVPAHAAPRCGRRRGQRSGAPGHGIFELKYFFSSHVGTLTGGEVSSTAIRALIRKLVADEDPRNPAVLLGAHAPGLHPVRRHSPTAASRRCCRSATSRWPGVPSPSTGSRCSCPPPASADGWSDPGGACRNASKEFCRRIRLGSSDLSELPVRHLGCAAEFIGVSH